MISGVVGELKEYNRSRFNLDALHGDLQLPLRDEPFVQTWAGYISEAAERGVFAVLREHLVQLRFPVEAGISETADYQAATRKGTAPSRAVSDGLTLKAPDTLTLFLYPTPAGRIPVLVISDRSDFVAILRALAYRNEPVPVPDSQGAMMLSGYNNWQRMRRLQQDFEAGRLAIADVTDWRGAFVQLRQHKELYQDRLLLLGQGAYSNVPGKCLGMPDAQWGRLSLIIRLEHECAHYVTRRLLHAMSNNILDELIADYAGITAAAGRFVADWCLWFMGLEEPHRFRAGGRLANYRGERPLSDAAFEALQQLTRRACRNLEKADAELHPANRSPAGRCRMTLALAQLSLDELANERGADRVCLTFHSIRVKWGGSE